MRQQITFELGLEIRGSICMVGRKRGRVPRGQRGTGVMHMWTLFEGVSWIGASSPEHLIYCMRKDLIYLLGQQVTVPWLMHWIPMGLLRQMSQSLRAHCTAAFFSSAQETVINLGGSPVECR